MIAITLATLLTIVIDQGTAQQQPPPTSLAALRSELRAVERAFAGLRVESDCTWYERSAGETEYGYAGGLQATFWFAAKPGGQARCEVHQEISPWKNGSGPFAEESHTTTYDGRVGRVLRTKTGAQGKSFDIQRSSIEPVRPGSVEIGARASGWRFSMPGFFDQIGRRFSDMMEADADHLELGSVVVAGAPMLRLQRSLMLGDVELRDIWILDPARRYALVDYENQEGARIVQKLTIEALVESKGLFWPARSVRTTETPDGGSVRELMVTKPTTLSDDEFAAVCFDLELRPGTIVEDPVSDVVMTIGYPADRLIPMLDAEGAELARSMASSSPLDESVLAAEVADGPLRGFVRVVLVGAGMALLLFGCLRLRRRIGIPGTIAKAGLSAGLLVAVTMGPATAQERSLAADELGSNRVANCGLNAAAVILHAFEREVDLDVLADELECGEHWERATSLGHLGALFESRGLRAETFERVRPEHLLGRLGHGNVALVHLARRSQTEGHFMVLGGVRSDEVFVVDPARASKWVGVRSFLDTTAKQATGYALLISAATAMSDAPAIPLLADDATVCSLDLGDISDVEGTVSASVRVRNQWSSPIELETSASSCTCFQGAVLESGAKQIPAGGEDLLHLQFLRSKFSVGENEQQVVVRLRHGSETRTVLFRVRATRRATEVARRVAVMPQQIDWGVVRNRAALSEVQRVSLHLPSGVTVRQANPSSPDIAVRRVKTTVDRGSEYRVASRTETYEVVLNQLAGELLREEIVFVLSDPQLKTVSVQLLAESRLQ